PGLACRALSRSARASPRSHPRGTPGKAERSEVLPAPAGGGRVRGADRGTLRGGGAEARPRQAPATAQRGGLPPPGASGRAAEPPQGRPHPPPFPPPPPRRPPSPKKAPKPRPAARAKWRDEGFLPRSTWPLESRRFPEGRRSMTKLLLAAVLALVLPG